MYSICVSLPPEPPKLLLSTFLLAYLSLFSVLPSCALLPLT